MTLRVLDRVPRFDEKSRNFPITAVLTADQQSPASRVWQAGHVLDQGSEGACVGFGWAAELSAIPAAVRDVDDNFGRAIYHRAQQLDEWEGENYSGSSVLGGAKAVREMGYMPEYRWAFGEEELAVAVSHHGPAVIGVNWYRDMFTADRYGIVRVSGTLAGGHCVMVRGLVLRPRWYTEPLYRIRQSWGGLYAKAGDIYMTRPDMARLLSEDGECCIPTRRNRTPKPELMVAP
jgi:hypothetical protein